MSSHCRSSTMDGSPLQIAMFPSSPDESPFKAGLETVGTSTAQNASALRPSRIRCKMCRQDLATREYLLHLGPLMPPIDTQGTVDRQPHQADLPWRSELGSSGVDTSRQRRDEGNAELSNTLVISPDTMNIEAKGQQISDSDLAAIRSKTEVAASPDPTDPNSNHTPASHTHPNPNLTSQILIDRKCSGYFVEPMKWMDHFLSAGSLAGKIICPNTKCGAKLGNYDWAGVCCGCKMWVTPGFCINRSKVDVVG